MEAERVRRGASSIFSPPTSEVDQYSRRHFVFFSPMLEVDIGLYVVA